MRIFVWKSTLGMATTGVVAVADDIATARMMARDSLIAEGETAEEADERIEGVPMTYDIPGAFVIDR